MTTMTSWRYGITPMLHCTARIRRRKMLTAKITTTNLSSPHGDGPCRVRGGGAPADVSALWILGENAESGRKAGGHLSVSCGEWLLFLKIGIWVQSKPGQINIFSDQIILCNCKSRITSVGIFNPLNVPFNVSRLEATIMNARWRPFRIR